MNIKYGYNLIYINDLKGLASKSGYISILLMVTLLSTAGIPLTIGFYAKYLVLDALVDRNLILIAVIVVLMTVVGLYYYLRVIWFMFFETGFNSLINTSGKFSTIILSLIFWGMIWGIIGVLLAAPLTAIIRVSFERFDSTRQIARLLEGKVHLQD